MAVFLLTLSLHLYMIIVVATVAPGDEEPLCEQFRAFGSAPIPAYSANMRVLMDSWNYQNLLPNRTGAVWNQVDNDENNPSGLATNWIQNSNTPCGQSVQVCGFSAGPQSNWLITQLINRTVNGTRLPQISVLIEFEQQGCDTTLNCQRTFNTHIYETSTENADAARKIRNYQQVRRVSPSDTSGTRVNETVMVSFSTNHSSFYFAIEDETSCIVVTRLMMFYYICPMQIADLIIYPEIFAPPGNQAGIPLVSVTASCVANAEPENRLAPLPSCLSEGIWSLVPTAGCRCIVGSFQSNETCEPCPIGTYLSPSNSSCSACPANSVSEEEGLTQCTCVEGYYRAAQGEEDLPCTSCPAGTYLSPSNGLCSACPANSVSEEEGLTQCTCVKGYYRAPQGEEDLPCTPMAMNITSGVSLAVIITIPSSFGIILLVVLTTTTIVLVSKRWNNEGTQTEAYYSAVGPPLPPVKLEKNQSYDGNLESLRIDNNSDRFYDIIVENSSTDTSIHHQPTVIITTDEDIAYHHTNTATASEIQTGENVAYSCELHNTIQENVAYGTNIAIAPEIQVEENVAYSHNFDNTCGPQDSSSPNEDVTDGP